MPDDAALLRRYAADHAEDAFAELVRRHLDGVYSAALRRVGGDVHLAEDVAQQVFAALARKAPALVGHPLLTGWLHTTTRHEAANLVRAERRRRAREQEALAMSEELTEAAPLDDWGRVAPVLDEAIDELAEQDRTAVLLRFVERCAYAEIGTRLRVSEDAARMRVERALEKLRGRLGRRGVTSTASALGVALANQAVVAAPAGLAATITGAALTGGAVIATGFFMSTSTVVLGTVALVAGSAALYQTNQSQHVRAELAALAREHAGLRAQVHAAGEREQKSAQQTAALQRELESARVFKATTAPVMSAVKPAAGGAGQLTFSASPSGGYLTLGGTPADPAEARRQARAREAVNVDASYTALYRKLGWTAEQQEQFRDLMFARKEGTEQLFIAAVKAAGEKNPQLDRAGRFEVFEATQAQGMLEEQAEVRRVFGDAAGQAMERYQTALPMRQVAGQLATALFYTDVPLAPAQAEALIDVLAGTASGTGGRIEISSLNVDTAVAQAQGLLNAAQLVELRRVIVRLQEQAKMDRARNTAPVPSGMVTKPAGG